MWGSVRLTSSSLVCEPVRLRVEPDVAVFEDLIEMEAPANLESPVGVEAFNEASEPAYRRTLSLFDGTMVVVGGIIGSGIFLSPAIVAQRVDTPFLILLAWALGGTLALVGAICFAELGARRPEAGGGYVYLRETFGPIFGFLYGWKLLLVSATGAIAALAIIFARYTVDLVGISTSWVSPIAVGAIVFLSGINYFGVKFGSITQNIFTVLKLLALAGMTIAGVALGRGDMSDGAGTLLGGSPSAWTIFAATGTALIPVLFSYGGWQHANHIAGELKNPTRNLPKALILGVAIVVASYLVANFAYLYALGVDGLATSVAPAAEAMERVSGATGATLISAGVVASVFGILNLYILAAPRVYQAMADDDLFFRRFAKLHPKYKTPNGPILLQGAWAIVLALTGTFGQLLDYVVFGDWIFFALVVATLFVYRRRERLGNEVRPDFRMFGFPLLPILFIAASGFIVFSSISSNPGNALIGITLISAGIPAYLFWRRRS